MPTPLPPDRDPAEAARRPGAPAERPGGDETRTAGSAPPDADGDDVFALLAPAERPDEVGRLGRYRVLRVLGRGGMGVVFEAQDERLKRRVALKAMLPAHAGSAAARRRFVREAEAAARVEHDNIMPVYDIAEANGLPFLAMPLLLGESLDDRLRPRQPLPAAEVLLVGRQVAEGLAAAHAAGLIHRDIKPSNVWLERTAAGAFRRARILDFGLARPAAGDALTASGAVLGTPAYMAPEQARGLPVDHRADLFSLGCVLYEMATGRRPFRGRDALAVLAALASDTPPPPAELNPALPPALAALIAGLMAKDPDRRRPAAAQDVADELARIAGGPSAEPAPPGELSTSSPQAVGSAAVATTDAAPSSRDERKPKPRGRGRLALALAPVLGALALAALFGGTLARLATGTGELVVEVDDPAVEVKVVRGGAVLVERTAARRFVLKAGAGEVIFLDPRTGAELARPFALAPAGRAVVRASAAEVLAAREPKPPPPARPAPDPPAPPPELFTAGSVWRGVRYIESGTLLGTTVFFELYVDAREGEQFTGRIFAHGPNRGPATLRGTARGTAIEWKEVAVANKAHYNLARGERTGTVLAMTHEGHFPPTSGNAGRTILYHVPAPGDPVPHDFAPILDGRTLDGWQAGPARPGAWSVNYYGQLVGSGGDGGAWLATKRADYADFHLRLRAKVTGGTGGVLVRAWAAPGGVTGCRAQFRTGGLTLAPGRSVPAGRVPPPEAQWFDLEVVVAGDTVRVLVNGKETARATGLAPARGRIALQVEPKSSVEVVLIAVKELRGGVPAR